MLLLLIALFGCHGLIAMASVHYNSPLSPRFVAATPSTPGGQGGIPEGGRRGHTPHSGRGRAAAGGFLGRAAAGGFLGRGAPGGFLLPMGGWVGVIGREAAAGSPCPSAPDLFGVTASCHPATGCKPNGLSGGTELPPLAADAANPAIGVASLAACPIGPPRFRSPAGRLTGFAARNPVRVAVAIAPSTLRGALASPRSVLRACVAASVGVAPLPLRFRSARAPRFAFQVVRFVWWLFAAVIFLS